MILHENRLPADDSHEISYLKLIFFFEKAAKFFVVLCCIVGGALRVNPCHANLAL